ncbi:adenosine deaminase/editase [Podospora appendiculata]|uniref:Adenosine deaminase/editase n=1 Tax=Podospora appendiculata TaxID=314037 RepID=A0AAE0XKU0_9PEZI|nr:adenosine deaminase/editase [Podospora appendiculata]
MTSEADAVASLVIDEFKKLPAKRKPSVRDNGMHEWVPLSGIVAQGPGLLKCVALATGMKCLPASKLPQTNGVAIHDWHAEILALRAFNHFVLEECRRLALSADNSSEFLRRRTADEIASTTAENETCWHGQPFAWRQDVKLLMYCSEVPCGDASMELIMAAQDDDSPWEVPPRIPQTPTADTATEPVSLPGRAYFSHLGVVRRKPSRGDAPPTLSKSCSDKIALKQCTSLLSALPALFVSPRDAYLTSLILPESQFSASACQRCFSADSGGGRMSTLAHRQPAEAGWGGGYAFVPFAVRTTTEDFTYSKRAVAARSTQTSASNLAVAWSGNGLEEGIIGGVLQGRKQFSEKGASCASRRKMWGLGRDVARLLSAEDGGVIAQALAAGAYDDLKEVGLLEARRRVKEETRREALQGWLRNTGDGSFSL